MENVNSDRNNAQVIITAAFLFAIGIVTIAALLNGLIFSQDIATRDDGVIERSVIGVEGDVRDAVSMAMTGDRREPSDAEDEYETYMESYEDVLQERLADNGRTLGVEMNDETPAWAIGQRCEDASCEFVNETGDEDWRVMDDSDYFDEGPYKVAINVTEALGGSDNVFDMTITEEDFNPADDLDDPGIIFPEREVANNGSLNEDDWIISVYDGAVFSEERILIGYVDNVPNDDSGAGDGDDWEDEIVSETYEIDEIQDESGEDYVYVDVLNETINGLEEIDGNTVETYPDKVTDDDKNVVRFSNGDEATGDYDLRFVDEDDDGDEIEGPCKDPAPVVCENVTTDNRDLYSVGVIHNASVELDYYGDGIEHSTTINETLEQDDLILEDR